MFNNGARVVMSVLRRFHAGVWAFALVAGSTSGNLGAQTPPRQPVDTGVRNVLPSRPMGTMHEAHAGMQGMQGMQGMSGMSDSMTPSAAQLLMDLMTDRVIRQRIMSDSILNRLAHETMAKMTPAQRDHMRLMMDDATVPANAEMNEAGHADHPAADSKQPAPGTVKRTRSAAPAARAPATPKVTPPKPAPAKPAPRKMPPMPGMDHSKMPGMGKP